jgi:hypothetical protein
VCDELVLNGYDDWYLPSLEELTLMWELRQTIGNFATDPNGFTIYGSSTERTETTSWDVQFNYNPEVPYWAFRREDNKGYPIIVRPVRTVALAP